jgi:exonuclease SbcC
MMIKAFQKIGGSPKVEPQDLMNPKSYFDLEFELRLENGDSNSGSNGQTYTANALLCLARLSLIEEKNKKGLKIMSIDEAEGLGSNYDMLHELAKKENYQIITMAIETAGDIKAGDQFIYIMNENNLADMDSYVPPLGIFSENIVEDINDYINSMPDDE